MFTLSASSPSCPHGPMISIAQPGKAAVRYVCSAFNQSSSCLLDSRITLSRWPVAELERLQPRKRGYCSTCDCLFACSTTAEQPGHIGHQTRVGISDQLLKMPSFLLAPLSGSHSAHAQYLFSLDSLNHLYSILHQLDVRYVLCVGTPRLHEFIQLERVHKQQSMDSFLLDLDVRLGCFHHSDRFARFNMVNGYFFTQSERDRFEQFAASLIQSDRSNYLLVCDPPFSAPLILVLEQMRSLCRPFADLPRGWAMHSDRTANHPPMFLVLPHFFGKKLRRIADEFVQLDYKITYANHSRLDRDTDGDVGASGESKGRRRDSVVRLFTNLSPAIVLPPEKLRSQFRFCSECERYSAKNNVHCNQCGTCPTKHGPTYVHCDQCGRCRPPNRVHCPRCSRCVASSDNHCPHQVHAPPPVPTGAVGRKRPRS